MSIQDRELKAMKELRNMIKRYGAMDAIVDACAELRDGRGYSRGYIRNVLVNHISDNDSIVDVAIKVVEQKKNEFKQVKTHKIERIEQLIAS